MKRLKTKLPDIMKKGIKIQKVFSRVSCYTDVEDKSMKKLMMAFRQVLSSIFAINLQDASS